MLAGCADQCNAALMVSSASLDGSSNAYQVQLGQHSFINSVKKLVGIVSLFKGCKDQALNQHWYDKRRSGS